MLLDKIEQIVKDTPNNMDLGKKIRSIFLDVWDGIDASEKNTE